MRSSRCSSSQHGRLRRRYGVVLVFALPALLPSCAQAVTGTPEGAAGFAPSPASVVPPQPLDGLDTCALLVAADLDRLGGAEPGPQRNELLPQSCAYRLTGAAPGDVAALAFHKPLDQARAQAPDGTLVDTAGYPTWLVCGVDDGYQSCSAAVAVRPDRTLLVLLSRRDVSEPSVRRDLEQLTRTALSRLPAR